METTAPVTELKGIGNKTAALFHRVGTDTVGELLSYYPKGYDVYKPPVSFANLVPDCGEKQAVTGFVKKAPSVRSAGRLKLTVLSLEEFGDRLQLVWFNMPYIKGRLKPGDTYIFRGFVKKEKGRLVMDQPEIFTPEDYGKMPSCMQPVYALTSGLSNKTVTKAVRQAYAALKPLPEYMPRSILARRGLIAYDDAVREIHFPENEERLSQARERLKFDEFLLYSLAVKEMKLGRVSSGNPYPIKAGEFARKLLDSLDFELTDAQKNAWVQIQEDLSGEVRMGRLLQGDVGSGKTLVAVLALLSVAECGYQGALMAPTEVLARQHKADIDSLILAAGIDVKTVLLTGGMGAAKRRETLEAIEDGSARIVIGTHALYREKVTFKNLALAVTDEQHRFGVRQRSAFAGKGGSPHVLSMSATPIPRTLASVIYGDMEISVIDELPAERLPIKNCVVGEELRPAALRFIEKEVKAGHQAYVVCPMVEEGGMPGAQNVTDYSERLRTLLDPSITVGCLHGKMPSDEKSRIMEEFAAGSIQVLVSTTVIEVGINVKNATVMLIEDADRFGLTQLHQLRGRVGRGEAQGYCIFMSGTENEDTKKRLKLLEESNDGFFIAGEDLKMRGPGDLPGVRQSGMPAFKLGDVFSDRDLFAEAALEAEELVREDPEFLRTENLNLGKIMLFNSPERWYDAD